MREQAKHHRMLILHQKTYLNRGNFDCGALIIVAMCKDRVVAKSAPNEIFLIYQSIMNRLPGKAFRTPCISRFKQRRG